MNPYVYIAYLCFTDNNSEVRKSFERWRHQGGNKASYNGAAYSLRSAIKSVAHQMEYKARLAFIYEAERAWANFNANGFIEFLERYGFKT